MTTRLEDALKRAREVDDTAGPLPRNAEGSALRALVEAVRAHLATPQAEGVDAWVPFTERAPTADDCDQRGDVVVLRSGRAMLWRVKPERPVDATHWQRVGKVMPDDVDPDTLSATPQAAQVPEAWVAMVTKLVRHIEGEACTHEETYRGGAIWEICRECGAKWADDKGGKPEFTWPACVEAANAMLAAAQAQGVGHD